jgi:hypothetical protein
MTSRGRRLLGIGVLVVLISAVVGAATYRRAAIWMAPRKTQIAVRGAAAVAADAVFWKTFHGARYDQLPDAIEVLTRAYLATPNDSVTAAHLAWLHMWRIAERVRLDAAPATITDDMLLARRYFAEAVRLDGSDPRTLGFLASAMTGEGSIQGDERLVREGYFTMLDAIKAWPAFNLFTAGYVMSSLPALSTQFREGLEWQWRDLEVCAGERIDRAHPAFARYFAQVKDRHACLNTWVAPHNVEGFFLNMGDMLVKAGDWQTAQVIYANARLSRDYAAWKFVAVLEDRIRNARQNVARFDGTDANPRSGLMINSSFSCMACHQQ